MRAAYTYQITHFTICRKCKQRSCHISATCSYNTNVLRSSLPTSGTHLLPVPNLPPRLNRSLEQFPCSSLRNIYKVAPLESVKESECFPTQNLYINAHPASLIHILLKEDKEKERTVKSGRNSVYGAQEHSCLLKLR